jgi:hypothetical protein
LENERDDSVDEVARDVVANEMRIEEAPEKDVVRSSVDSKPTSTPGKPTWSEKMKESKVAKQAVENEAKSKVAAQSKAEV